MRKLRLTFDDLAVESFEINPTLEGRTGTVRGRQDTEGDTCYYTVVGPCYTVEYFCGASEDGSCDDSQCAGDSCGYWVCDVTYNETCPNACRTLGVVC